MPSPDGGDDFVWISDPLEGFGIGIVVIEEAVDGDPKIDDGTEDAALQTALKDATIKTYRGSCKAL
jgi:hypothetical protein